MKYLITRLAIRVMVLTMLLSGTGLLTGCQRNSNSVKTVQPVFRKRPYNHKKDKRRKRLKRVRKTYN